MTDKHTPDEYASLIVEVVGEPTEDEQKQVDNVMKATMRIVLVHGGALGVWLRGDGRAEIVPNWVVSARKMKQRAAAPTAPKEG